MCLERLTGSVQYSKQSPKLTKKSHSSRSEPPRHEVIRLISFTQSVPLGTEAKIRKKEQDCFVPIKNIGTRNDNPLGFTQSERLGARWNCRLTNHSCLFVCLVDTIFSFRLCTLILFQ
jgi:hypothetical protein